MSKQQRRRAQILQEMAAIDRMEKGRVTAEYRERISQGRPVQRGPYYKHQRWEEGRNVSRRVPLEEVAALEKAVAGYHQFKALSEEYAALTIEMTRARTQSAEDKPRPG